MHISAPPRTDPGWEPAGTAPTTRRAVVFFRVFALTLTLVALLTLGALAWYGADYYRLPVTERIRHPLHDQLKPSGTLGRRLGIVGTGLIVLNLLYSVRRRWRRLERFGSPRLWLEIHVFCGLFGSALLAFHSAFLARHLVAKVSALSTGVLVVAGVIGRYLYAQIPRNLYGQALEREELERRSRALLARYLEDPRLTPEIRDAIRDAAAHHTSADPNGLRLVLGSIRSDLGWARRWWRLTRTLKRAGLEAAERHEITRAARKLASLGVRTAYLKGFQRVLERWRGLHLRLAIVMIVAALVHIGTVAAMGYAIW